MPRSRPDRVDRQIVRPLALQLLLRPRRDVLRPPVRLLLPTVRDAVLRSTNTIQIAMLLEPQAVSFDWRSMYLSCFVLTSRALICSPVRLLGLRDPRPRRKGLSRTLIRCSTPLGTLRRWRWNWVAPQRLVGHYGGWVMLCLSIVIGPMGLVSWMPTRMTPSVRFDISSILAAIVSNSSTCISTSIHTLARILPRRLSVPLSKFLCS